MKRLRTIAAAGAVLATLLSGAARAETRTGSTLEIEAEVTDGAGDTVTSASFTLVTAVSQTQVGEAQSTNYTLEIGFLPGDPANTFPVLAFIGPQSPPEHFIFEIDLEATDPDVPPQMLFFDMLTPPPGATLDAATGLFSFRPDESQGGDSYTVTFTVDDGEGGFDSLAVQIDVIESGTGEGDVDQDGDVDAIDIGWIALYFAQPADAYPNADLDENGTIGGGAVCQASARGKGLPRSIV